MQNLYILAKNGQICARHSLHSPTAANGRKVLCHFLSASLANTPLLSQYLKQQILYWITFDYTQIFHQYRAGTYLLFHSAWPGYSGLPDVQLKQSFQPRSSQRLRSYNGLCPLLHVGASLAPPTDLKNMFYNHSCIMLDFC